MRSGTKKSATWRRGCRRSPECGRRCSIFKGISDENAGPSSTGATSARSFSPDARLKFFVDADIEVRIQRRFAELEAREVSFLPELLREDLMRRDERDRHRASAPLRKAEDAEEIDTSDMNVDQVLEVMLEKIRSVYGEVIEDA